MPAARSKKERATPPSDDSHTTEPRAEYNKSKRKYVTIARSFSVRLSVRFAPVPTFLFTSTGQHLFASSLQGALDALVPIYYPSLIRTNLAYLFPFRQGGSLKVGDSR
jgi:hypothetical protein